jgi:hypothetical protein
MLLFTRALLVASALSGAACNVYDAPLPYSNGDGSVDSSIAPDACTPKPELCNLIDDDCDGKVDEAEDVKPDCASKVQNRPSTCEVGFCVRSGDCYPGFHNCDGLPDNGCESACPCTGCDQDAGPEAE